MSEEVIEKLRDPNFKPASLAETGLKTYDYAVEVLWDSVFRRLRDLENADKNFDVSGWIKDKIDKAKKSGHYAEVSIKYGEHEHKILLGD